MKISNDTIGSILTITGVIISIIATLLNNLWLYHRMAMILWLVSNPLLFTWAFGYWRKWWNGSLSAIALVIMYLIFFVTGAIGVFCGGIV